MNAEGNSCGESGSRWGSAVFGATRAILLNHPLKIFSLCIEMDPAVRKEKFAELTKLYDEIVKAHRARDKATRDAKVAERKVKVAEFQALKKATKTK
jgi:hypothetical protein